MSWRVRLEIRDVSNLEVANAILELSTWTGSGNVAVESQRPVGATVELTVPDPVINVVVALRHPRYAPLVVNLVRGPNETRWRWTDPRVVVTTDGQLMTVRAVLSRVRPAPLTFVSEEALTSRAEQTKGPLDTAARNHKPPRKPPDLARMHTVPGVLRDRDNRYRNSGLPDEPAMHILAQDPLGDAGQTDWPVNAPGWGRFRTTSQSVTPVIEYGEISTQNSGPRFLVAVWLPHELAKVGRSRIDFLVWLEQIALRLPGEVNVQDQASYPGVVQLAGASLECEPVSSRQHPGLTTTTADSATIAHGDGRGLRGWLRPIRQRHPAHQSISGFRPAGQGPADPLDRHRAGHVGPGHRAAAVRPHGPRLGAGGRWLSP